ncbi:3-oxoacyl-ACP synthase III family protein [Streptosporangium saharense]|uniref:3-oxoacyl-ACP synthase III family protein n=1 Tax=Streptosporangium saharense TaxID=1706840 RepID=UPI00367AC80A
MECPDVRIAAVGTALPGPVVDNATLMRRFGLAPVWEQWIDAFVGTRSRHLAVDLDTGEIVHSLADIAESAARVAMERAGVTAADVDMMVMGSATPDDLMPATVNCVADRLGVNDVPTYQLLSGCTGAYQALDIAVGALTSGQRRTALVLGGDTCARFLDLDMDLEHAPPDLQVNVMLFGDGAGAAVLTTEPVPSAPVLRTVFHRMVGLGRSPGQVVRWRGAIPSDEPVASEDFKAIEEHAPDMAAQALAELLERLGWKPVDLDYIMPPQLSGQMTRRVADRLGVPGAEEINVVEEIANTANALPFFLLERLLPLMQPGERAAGVSLEASKWIKAGYALELT